MKVVVDRRSDTEGWNQIVHRMISAHNAPIQGEDATAISNYLGKTLSKSTPALELPIHVNTAPKEDLNFLGLLPPEEVQKIVTARTKAKINNFAELSAVVGDKNIDKYKGVLAFD
jgi:DNA uptake protein ComE-like DNA-binding protein